MVSDEIEQPAGDMPEGGAQENPQQPEGQEPDQGKDLQAEVDKWKALARKHETAAKSNSAARRSASSRVTASNASSGGSPTPAATAFFHTSGSNR